MLIHRRWESLDRADLGWLRAKHHFAVSADGNPAHGALGPLIVWNDDEIAIGSGFPMHGHRDMEIVTYVRQGLLGHRDTLGSEGAIHAGDVQVMSAGTGIRHSEHNEGDTPIRLFQIWLRPSQPGGEPRWGNKPFPRTDRAGAFIPLASGRNAPGALPIRTDAEVSGAMLNAGSETTYNFKAGDAAYLVPATGEIEVNGKRIEAREGLVIREESAVTIKALEDSEVVLIVTAA